MTLAGTRPILQDELQKYELHHRARIAIKSNKSWSVKYHKVFIFGHSLDITDKDILRKFILNENVKIIIFYTDKEDYKKKIINLIKIIGQDELVKRTGGKNKTIVFQKINTCTLESDSMREK